MLSIEDGDLARPRVSSSSAFEKRRSSFSLPLSPLLIIGGLSSKSIVRSYSKLPQEPLNLTVLKLDGSSFDIEVTKTATVLDLKQAVEDVFSHLQQKGPVKISWPHVWGHFCLSYEGQKLVAENDHIKYYGIRDGDQLHFIRHRSVNYNLVKKRSKKEVKQERMPLSRSDSYEEQEQNGKERYNCDDLENGKGRDNCDDLDNDEHRPYAEKDLDNCDDLENGQHRPYDENDLNGFHEPKMTHFLAGWFSYSRLSTSNARSESLGSGLCNGVRNFIRLYSDKPYHRRETWRDD